MTATAADIKYLIDLIRQRSGITLTPDKTYLLESRLLPIARDRGLSGLHALVEKLRAASTNDPLLAEITDAMTTNETLFFRDNRPFQYFQELALPRLLESRAAQKKIRIWSAAASTGQEPYTLAMCLMENAAKLQGWSYEIVGTDLSAKALERAKAGRYSQFEVQRGLPITMLMKYFTQDGEGWRVKDEVKKHIRYQPQNLLESFSALGVFDVIFCRNVLIYFDDTTKAKVFAALAKSLAPDGLLFLGASETAFGISDAFTPLTGYNGVFARK